jgi:hypothetical protein
MVDHVQFSKNFEHDGFIMFKIPDFSYLTSFSRIEKGES